MRNSDNGSISDSDSDCEADFQSLSSTFTDIGDETYVLDHTMPTMPTPLLLREQLTRLENLTLNGSYTENSNAIFSHQSPSRSILKEVSTNNSVVHELSDSDLSDDFESVNSSLSNMEDVEEVKIPLSRSTSTEQAVDCIVTENEDRTPTSPRNIDISVSHELESREWSMMVSTSPYIRSDDHEIAEVMNTSLGEPFDAVTVSGLNEDSIQDITVNKIHSDVDVAVNTINLTSTFSEIIDQTSLIGMHRPTFLERESGNVTYRVLIL